MPLRPVETKDLLHGVPTLFNVAFFDGVGGWRHGRRGCPRTSRRAIGSFPGRTRRGARGGGRLDDQANFPKRRQQLAGSVFAARPVEDVAIEQAPTIKTIVGASANAMKTRIWTALICMLLRYPHLRSRFGWCLSNLGLLMNLFSHRDLHD